jgi:hypothetical protein
MSENCLNRIISSLFNQINIEFFGKNFQLIIDRLKKVDESGDDIFTRVRKLTSWIKETLLFRALDILEVNHINSRIL